MIFNRSDEAAMREAVALALRGFGRTDPNPIVGAVLTRDDRIVGRGWHRRCGGPHAEIYAIDDLDRASCTLYTTLEPCCTWGRTPPCTDAILRLRSRITRVVVGTIDPNPDHQGRGIEILRKAGVVVEVGCLSSITDGLNPPSLRYPSRIRKAV